MKSQLPNNTKRLTSREIANWFSPRKVGRDVNKGAFGHVLVIGGSERYSGAPILAAEASLRAGSGKVTVGVPRMIANAVSCRLSAAIMLIPFGPLRSSSLAARSAEEAIRFCEETGITVVALGMGIGLAPGTSRFLKKFLLGFAGTIVLDADGLTLLSQISKTGSDQGASLLRRRLGETILTPHPAELASLLDTTVRKIQSNRESVVQTATEKFGCTIVLKGSETLIAHRSHGRRKNPTGNPGLATAGSGDVLAGTIAGIIAQGVSPWRAACAGAFLHGRAGDIVAKNFGTTTGLIATDFIAALPLAIAKTNREL